MDKAATFHLTLHVEGEDVPANRFADESLALIHAALKEGIIVVSKRRCAMGLPFRKITLMEITELKGGDDNNGN